MRPCTRVGTDVTWRCNAKCLHCFYLRNSNLHRQLDVPFHEVRDKIKRAKDAGLDHVVMVGYGEPSLCPNTPAILEYCQALGMATSMITNGATGLDRFKGYFHQGLDHLHISSHGLKATLDEILGVPGAFAKQVELKTWLKQEGLPFRINVTLQQRNYRELLSLAEFESEMGVYHFVFLGFLPHYEWAGHVPEIAVHPAELRPYIEDAADILLARNRLFTIRYHPFCHLAPQYWKYVVNARYVFFDSTEWNYELQVKDVSALWQASLRCGDSVAVQGKPCSECLAQVHCGKWNRTYANAFDGAGLTPITEIPKEYQDVWNQEGGVFDLNPATRIPSRIRSS